MAKPHKVGLVVGSVLGGMHFLWSIAVAVGIGQWYVNFIFWAHMIHMPITVGPFDATAAVTLVIVTAVIGYVAGYIGGWVWNRVHR